jgi:hypothetical protein
MATAPTGFPGAMKALFVALVVVVALVALNYSLERARRTAETPIEVIVLDSFAAPGKGARGGFNVQYRFVVDGAVYESVEFRNWSLESINRAKVCYDPADPRNRSLTKVEDSCP